MASLKNNLKFREEIISEFLLDYAIEFIKANLSPEDVFTTAQLVEWADRNYEREDL